MNRATPKRKILVLLTCIVGLLAVAGPVPSAGGDDEAPLEPSTGGVTAVPIEEPVAGSTTERLHAQVVRGLPFSNFDLFALIAVLIGLTSISLAVDLLNRPPRKSAAAEPSITTDAG